MRIIPIETIEKITEMERKQIQMLLRLFLGDIPKEGTTMCGLLIMLICDFFRRSGMAFETYATSLPTFTKDIQAYADKLENAIKEWREIKKCFVPRCFVTLIDNRYVGVYVGETGSPKLWDMLNDNWVALPETMPVFSLTLSVPMLYFKAAAFSCDDGDVAGAFKSAMRAPKGDASA